MAIIPGVWFMSRIMFSNVGISTRWAFTFSLLVSSAGCFCIAFFNQVRQEEAKYSMVGIILLGLSFIKAEQALNRVSLYMNGKEARIFRKQADFVKYLAMGFQLAVCTAICHFFGPHKTLVGYGLSSFVLFVLAVPTLFQGDKL